MAYTLPAQRGECTEIEKNHSAVIVVCPPGWETTPLQSYDPHLLFNQKKHQRFCEKTRLNMHRLDSEAKLLQTSTYKLWCEGNGRG